MVSFADAVSRVTVSGKRLNNLPESCHQLRHVLTSQYPIPKLNEFEKSRFGVTVNSARSMSVSELVGRYQTQLDSCGEWATWSKNRQIIAKRKV